ncbi:condensin-2 complex subunit G2 [Denticeps clupeoides]|uniref:Condensin-2 complex subunit G2 n=1 Tax=Denticeps clupeoides TaxID=299321 RepID=A0AAY4CL22_9TELE|nr:condensin-2 complex subunit G2 [Denticeps clupeoides]
MSKRGAFLDSVCRKNTEDFLNFIQLHKDRSEPFELQEVLQELEVASRKGLWARLCKLLQDTVAACPPESWNAGPQEKAVEGMEVDGSSALKRTMMVIQGVTLVATTSVEVIQDGDTYTTLLQCAHLLNNLLSSIPESEGALQQSIYSFFECWWKKGLHGKEELGLTTFLFCLKKSVPDVKRLWSFHELLLNVDFESEQGRQITNLLLLCCLQSNHIKRDEGKRFLVFLFSWNVKFIRMIHSTLKNQLQFIPKAATQHVAEIYFRAWKNASGTFLEEIESTCIQDFMQHAVLLLRTSPVLPKVRQILRYFHKQKFRSGIDEMLYRLYKPILWRALKATNGEVRANATVLLAEAFPLQDPSMSSETMDQVVQKQLDAVFSMLDDPQPLVRSSAILATCTILSKCWELIPSTILTDFMKKLVLQLATDTSSADVRCSVYMCMSVILDNNMSHAVMENLLPVLRTSLHDSSEKVRVAFINFLLKIKAVRAAKFWKVCSMEHLLARLERDTPPVCKRIVDLLFNSFFPVNQSEEVWCERCVTLIQMNSKAARKFYQYVHLYTAPTNVAKLMLAIRKCLNVCIQRAREEDPNDTSSTNKENTSVLDDVLSVRDTASMARLMEVIVILWRSIEKSLQHNDEAQKYVVAKFASVLPEYLRVFQDDRSCNVPLLCMASLLPPASVPTISCGVLSRLKKLEVGAPVSQYSLTLDCLCSWGQAASILELITDWLTEALPKTSGKADKNSSTRRVRVQDMVEAKPDLVLDYLEYILTHPRTRDWVLSLPMGKLKQLLKALSSWKLVLYSCVSTSVKDVSAPNTETALRAFSLHGRLCIHLHHRFPEDRGFLPDLEHSAAWVTERILPLMVAFDDSNGGISEQQLKLTQSVVENCLAVFRDVVNVGLADAEFKGQALDLCSRVLLSDKGYVCIPPLLSVLTMVATDCMSQDSSGQNESLSVHTGVITNIFHKTLEVLAGRLRKEREEGEQVCHSALDALGGFLSVAQEWVSVWPEGHSGVFSSLFAALIVETSHAVCKISHVEEVITPETAKDLPPLSSVILMAVLKSRAVTRSLLSVAAESLDSEEIDSLAGLAAVTHVLTVVRQSGKFKADLKYVATSAQRQLQCQRARAIENSEEIQRLIYESSVRTINEILMP